MNPSEPALRLDALGLDAKAPRAIPCPRCGKSLKIPAEIDHPAGLCPHCGCEMDLSRWQSGEATPVESDGGDDGSAALVGQTLGGYALRKILGRGGMSFVYLGEHEVTHEEVAVKVLRADMGRRSRLVERFERESEALARLSHPNIVQLLDRGVDEGRYYLVMERVGKGSGQPTSLKTLIRRRALTIPQSIQIVQKVLSALQAAHAKGVIHRDVKPTNILIDDGGEVKVTDFGIARFVRHVDPEEGEVSPAPGGQNLPSDPALEDEVVSGSQDYMAPEARRKTLPVGPAADVFSVGVLLYEMVVRRRPGLKFVAPSKILPGLGPFLDSILEKALSEDASARYGSATRMLAAIDEALDSPGGDTVTSTRVASTRLEWEEPKAELASGEYSCRICGKTGPAHSDRCFYCGLSKYRKCAECHTRMDLVQNRCPSCQAAQPPLDELVRSIVDAEGTYEAFRANTNRLSRRLEIAFRALEKYQHARQLGADERDVRARAGELKRELARMLLVAAQRDLSKGRLSKAKLEVERVLQFGDVPEARALLDQIEERLRPAEDENENEQDREREQEVATPALVSVSSATPAVPDASLATPSAPTPQLEPAAGRSGLLGLAAVVVLGLGAAWVVVEGLPLARGPGRVRMPTPERTWTDAVAESRDLVESGRPFEAARLLHESTELPGRPSTGDLDDELESLVEKSIELRLAAGTTREAYEDLAWWTTIHPLGSATFAQKWQVAIFEREAELAVAASDFTRASGALAALTASAPEGDFEGKRTWLAALDRGIEDAVRREAYVDAHRAAQVLVRWGTETEARRGERFRAFLSPFAREASLSSGYFLYHAKDLEFGLPLPRGFVSAESSHPSLHRFVLAKGGAVQASEATPFSIIVEAGGPSQGKALEARAREFVSQLRSQIPGLVSVSTAKVEFAGGLVAHVAALARSETDPRLSVEVTLFKKGSTFYIFLWILETDLERELRPLLAFSLENLRIF